MVARVPDASPSYVLLDRTLWLPALRRTSSLPPPGSGSPGGVGKPLTVPTPTAGGLPVEAHPADTPRLALPMARRVTRLPWNGHADPEPLVWAVHSPLVADSPIDVYYFHYR